MWIIYLTHIQGEAHLVAKPRHPTNNWPNTPKGPGEGGVDAVASAAEAELERQEIGEQGRIPPLTESETIDRIAMRKQGVGQRRRQKRKRTKTRKGTEMEIPQGGHSQSCSAWGGCAPPQRKTRTYLTLPQNVHTCFCRDSMEMTGITMMGRTWTGESQTTLCGSVVGDG